MRREEGREEGRGREGRKEKRLGWVNEERKVGRKMKRAGEKAVNEYCGYVD